VALGTTLVVDGIEEFAVVAIVLGVVEDLLIADFNKRLGKVRGTS